MNSRSNDNGKEYEPCVEMGRQEFEIKNSYR